MKSHAIRDSFHRCGVFPTTAACLKVSPYPFNCVKKALPGVRSAMSGSRGSPANTAPIGGPTSETVQARRHTKLSHGVTQPVHSHRKVPSVGYQARLVAR